MYSLPYSYQWRKIKYLMKLSRCKRHDTNAAMQDIFRSISVTLLENNFLGMGSIRTLRHWYRHSGVNRELIIHTITSHDFALDNRIYCIQFCNAVMKTCSKYTISNQPYLNMLSIIFYLHWGTAFYICRKLFSPLCCNYDLSLKPFRYVILWQKLSISLQTIIYV